MSSADRVKKFRDRLRAKGMREVRCWLKQDDIDVLRQLEEQYGESSHKLIARSLRVLEQVTANTKRKKVLEQTPCRRRARYSLLPIK